MEAAYHNRIKNGFSQIYSREIGVFKPRNFSHGFSASETIVKQMNLYLKLMGHEGCVNSVEFNSSGDLVVSGSDDKQVVLWDWVSKSSNFCYSSGHFDNIFQTKFMPFCDDRVIVTSSADGQVRVGHILENGGVDTKRLGKHRGTVNKLAIEPGSPHTIYSCGEDGFVQHFDLRTQSAAKVLCCLSFLRNSSRSSSRIKLNAIVIDPRNPCYFAAGGSDEYARVYDLRKCRWDASSNSDTPVNTFCPRHLIDNKNVHITGLAYSNTSELLVSYNDELIYLFQKNMGIGPSPLSVTTQDLQRLEEPQVYSGHRNLRTVKGVNFFGPNDEYVLSGSDCGNIFIWKKRGGKLVRLMVGDRRVVNQFDPHPHMPLFASCGIEKSVKIWAPMATEDSPLPDNVEKIMESNKRGREDHSQVTLTPDVIMHILRLQRRQTAAYIERRYNRGDVESDNDEDETYVLDFSAGDASSEEGSEENSGECNIN